VNPPAAPRRNPRLRRRAVVALIAGSAAVIASLPAHAATSAHRQAGSRHPIAAAAVTTSTGSARPSYPLHGHRHSDAAKRTATAPAAHSKRDGGQSELAVPSVRAAAAINPAARWPASSVALARAARSTAARAPPVRQ
jgi:hypothetical protein